MFEPSIASIHDDYRVHKAIDKQIHSSAFVAPTSVVGSSSLVAAVEKIAVATGFAVASGAAVASARVAAALVVVVAPAVVAVTLVVAAPSVVPATIVVAPVVTAQGYRSVVSRFLDLSRCCTFQRIRMGFSLQACRMQYSYRRIRTGPHLQGRTTHNNCHTIRPRSANNSMEPLEICQV